MNLDEKIKEFFPNFAVNKKLALIKEVSRLPRFIGEYLIMKFTQDEDVDTERLSEFVNKYYPNPEDKNRVLYELFKNQFIYIIDAFQVKVRLNPPTVNLIIPSLQIYNAEIEKGVLEGNKELLRTEVWGFGKLQVIYKEDIKRKTIETSDLSKMFNEANIKGEGVSLDNLSWSEESDYEEQRIRDFFTKIPHKIRLVEFHPYQVFTLAAQEFISQRENFSTYEWKELILRSIGLEPSVYNEEQKFYILARLTPLVENNVNLIELGPKATGKTYLYRNTSFYTRIFAGGAVSPAIIFYHGTYKMLGEIGVRDCLIFDELSKTDFKNQKEMLGKFKDFMVDGFFERLGLKRAHSNCSLVFVDNIEVPEENISILKNLPAILQDAAFLDRVHAFIPGWQLPKITQTKVHLAHGYGLSSDYISEVFHYLKNLDFTQIIDKYVKFHSDITIRDEKAIKKIASGLLKIVYPDKQFTKEELKGVIDMTIRLRQNINTLLNYLEPDEFPLKKWNYSLTLD